MFTIVYSNNRYLLKSEYLTTSTCGLLDPEPLIPVQTRRVTDSHLCMCQLFVLSRITDQLINNADVALLCGDVTASGQM